MIFTFKMRGSLLKSQEGQAITELSIMMGFLAVILLGMVFVSGFVSENVTAIERLRHEMRISMYQNAGGPFTKNIEQQSVMIPLPGRMKQIFNAPYLGSHHRIEFYEGAYTGPGKSYYVLRELYREIEL